VIIQASLATRRASGPDGQAGDGRGVTRRGRPRPADRIDPERALAAALAVGDRLAESAYRDRVGWLGLHFAGEAQWLAQPLDLDLYSGYPGVAVFLSQLAALTGEQRYAELARRIVAPIEQLADVFDDQPADPSRCSAFSSLAGVAYALVHVAANLVAPELAAPVAPLVAVAASGVGEDEALDVIGGSAGGPVAMLSIHQATGLAGALDVARACADRLVETTKPQDAGVAWATAMQATQPLTGFSHGAAGIGWALLRFAAATGDGRYAKVGLDAFAYERSRYRPELGNWPDFRVPPVGGPAPAADSLSPMSAWCHGAPGIGLARADSGHLHLPEVAADLDLALRSLLAAGPSPNLSLCHGQLGNLELLTVAAADSPERTAWAAHALASFEDQGPVCGTPTGISTPGLMAGLAGIGHGLLRLAFPDRVPSALLLQPPTPCR
jgi:type 2 lantibiotic biosynthesis protein LanM